MTFYMASDQRAAAERLWKVRRDHGDGYWSQSSTLWLELRSLLGCFGTPRLPDAPVHQNGARLRAASADALWRPISDAIAEGGIGAAAAPPASFVAVDIEATDVGRMPRIVSIGAAFLHSANEFYTLINPGVPIDASATAIHGITDAAVARAPPFEDAIHAFFTWAFSRVPAGAPLVICGHNVRSLDTRAIDAEFRRFPDAADRVRSIRPNLAVYTVDSLEIAQLVWPEAASYKLAALHEEVFGRPHAEAHHALGDARATKLLLTHPKAAPRAAVMVRPWATFLTGADAPNARGAVVVVSTRAGVVLCTVRLRCVADVPVADVCSLAEAAIPVSTGKRVARASLFCEDTKPNAAGEIHVIANAI